ncbi:MAG TPA: sugar ABC transporter permease [Candidatus Limnocylindria bacterium]|nr:sugar ABC transporter permease [Candidatus Limnocylindria bacterium]
MAIVELEGSNAGQVRPPRFDLSRVEAIWGLVFISPWMLGFLLLTLGPMVATLVFTFTNINLIQDRPVQFVGLANYEQLISDPRTWDALLVTFKFAAVALPIGLLLPFSLAMLLNSPSLRGARYFQALFFMPFVIPFVAALFAWGGMLNSETGWINGLLSLFGVDGPDWLNNPSTIYPALVLIGLWGIGSAIIINLAGLQNVPTELYDAARVDGAGWWGQLRHVTLPLMSPVIFYNITLGTVGVLQYFLVPLVLNSGDGRPGGTTFFFNVHLYKTFFTFQDMSAGATLAWFLFVIILAATLLLFWSARYWVYYAGDTR